MRDSMIGFLNIWRTAALTAVLALAFALAACGSADEVPTQEPQATEPPDATAVMTEANTPVATAAAPTAVMTEPAPTAAATATAPAATAADPATEPAPTAAATAPPALEMAQLFTLPSANGDLPVSLESYRGNKNVVVIFYRGFW